MSRKKNTTIAAFILVFALLLTSTTNVFANTISADGASEYEQGGIWSNVLKPYLYYPSGEVVGPAYLVGEPVVDQKQALAMQALMQFSSELVNGSEALVTGVFVNDILAYPVIQQPSGSAAFVSSQDNVVTQFALAEKYGTIGILAHNFLAGFSFFNLSSGQDVYVVYGDGATAHYIVTGIRRFQALSPYSAYSEFIDLDTGNRYTSSDVFYEVYANDNGLVLQTCIAAEGVDSWGRLFVIAERVY